MKVIGTNFTNQAVILWNGSQLSTSMVDANTLAAPVQGGSLAVPGTVHVQVQNSQTGEASQAVPVMIAPPASNVPTLTISTTSLSSGVIGTSYSASINPTGGTAPYTFSISSGQLPAGLSLSASSGVVYGTPTVTGTFTLGITVSDSGSPQQTTSTSLTLTVAATKLALGSPTLPGATVTQAYSGVLSVTGGTAPYVWSVSSGQLPAGLSITPATGVISGTPTAIATSNFSLTVTDSGNPVQTATASSSIIVAPTALTITTSTLLSGTIGASYSQALQASGGTAPYSWSITSGSLPAGLTLAASGAISGTPTASGTFNLTATVHDAGSPAQTKSVSTAVVIAPSGLTITASTLGSGTIGSGYSQILQASGGTAPYTWSITVGSLPAGLTLATGGGISGTPTAVGTFNFTATVKDSGNPAQTKSVSTSIAVSPSTLTITASSLPSGTFGTTYSQSLQASGGTAPYSWSIISGTLPAGLTLSGAGAISGTPTANGTFNFTATVQDSGNPAQTKSVSTSIVVSPGPLAITSPALVAGTDGTAYAQVLQASGGTPGYTWSISAGGLPGGLTLAATTGTISGTPSASGTFSFTATVSDSSNPVQTKSVATSIVVTPAPGGPTTWYVNPITGGTRYSSLNTSGQCNGQSSAAYVSGINQPCPFNDPRLLWNDPYSYNTAVWVIAGGDTVIFSGFEQSTGHSGQISGSTALGLGDFCFGIGPYCTPPALPSGTSGNPTTLVGVNCQTSCYTTSTNGYIAPVGWQIPDPTKIEYLWAGGSSGGIPQYALDTRGTSYVTIQGLDFSDHSSCNYFGSPVNPNGCTNAYLTAGVGIITNNATSNLTMQDVRLHGFQARGLWGPIGGPIVMTRMQINFNGFAGWDFDDQASPSTPDAAGSSITANYVIMTGNGCNEEYPVTDSYPAWSCYDSGTGGFGDSWSGQNTELDSFTCNHCAQLYNTKDGFIGPHTQVKTYLIENSVSIGNEGQQWKWVTVPNSSTTFVNNLTVGNCNRLSAPIPGQPSNYYQNLGAVCRAAGDFLSFSSAANSTVLLANNTVVGYSETVFDLNCIPSNTCGTTPFVFTNNIILGYTQPVNSFPGANGEAPGLFYFSDTSDSIVSTYNDEYAVRNGDCPTSSGGILCTDPLFLNEPSQTWVNEAAMDVFNFTPSSSSPAKGAGISLTGVTTDFNGATRPNPSSDGAVEP